MESATSGDGHHSGAGYLCDVCDQEISGSELFLQPYAGSRVCQSQLCRNIISQKDKLNAEQYRYFLERQRRAIANISDLAERRRQHEQYVDSTEGIQNERARQYVIGTAMNGANIKLNQQRNADSGEENSDRDRVNVGSHDFRQRRINSPVVVTCMYQRKLTTA